MSNYSFERKVALYTRIREPMGDTHFTIGGKRFTILRKHFLSTIERQFHIILKLKLFFSYSYSLPTQYEYTTEEAEEPPFEYRGRGRHHDERYDHENREESGKHDVRNYRTPIGNAQF